MRHLPVAFLLLLCGPVIASAQVPAEDLVPGDRIRFVLMEPFASLPREGEATFSALDATAVTLKGVTDSGSSNRVEIPRELIREFEVARGSKDIAIPLAVLGAGIGCAIGFSLADNSGDQSGGIGACFGGVLAGGGVGFVGGGFIKGPRWESVALE